MDAGAEEDEGLLAQVKDDDNASGYFYRRKACLPLSAEGTFTVTSLLVKVNRPPLRFTVYLQRRHGLFTVPEAG